MTKFVSLPKQVIWIAGHVFLSLKSDGLLDKVMYFSLLLQDYSARACNEGLLSSIE